MKSAFTRKDFDMSKKNNKKQTNNRNTNKSKNPTNPKDDKLQVPKEMSDKLDDNISDEIIKSNMIDKESYKENDKTDTEQKDDRIVEDTDNKQDGSSQEDIDTKKKKISIYKKLRILFTIAFFVFLGLFINEVAIQPYKMHKAIDKAKELYHSDPVIVEEVTQNNQDADEDDSEVNGDETTSNSEITPTPTPDPNRDEEGRLKKFSKLLEVNEDVKGWIKIDNTDGENDTKIDYVVVQSDANDPEFYLNKDWATKEYLKAGSIFLDYTSSVEDNSKNLIIHGHNMTSSDDMFHYLLDYRNINFLKEHPIISFDTIYEEGLWKVFAVVTTPGNNNKGDYFQFIRSNFKNDRDFIEYIYQVRIRSRFNIDDVDINEDDQILTLSTCSYELPNYRLIILARKVREGEDISVNTDTITENKDALFPASFHQHYGTKVPDIPSFDAALEDGNIHWYNPMER